MDKKIKLITDSNDFAVHVTTGELFQGEMLFEISYLPAQIEETIQIKNNNCYLTSDYKRWWKAPKGNYSADEDGFIEIELVETEKPKIFKTHKKRLFLFG